MERRTKWRPERIAVSITQAGCVRLAQEDPTRDFSRDGEVVISIDTDDVDQIITWMQEMKAEIIQSKAAGEDFDNLDNDESEDQGQSLVIRRA